MIFSGYIRYNQLSAPLVIDGPMNGITFRAYVEEMLAPILAPGDIVVMDNLSAHKEASHSSQRGATLLYPPLYCPDFNPIEQAFAKLKALLRKTHPVDVLWTAIGSFLERFAPDESAK